MKKLLTKLHIKQMNKLINEVKKSMAISKVAIEKDKIKRMLNLIAGKEQDLKDIKEEINTLKEQLKKGDYGAVKDTNSIWVNCSGDSCLLYGTTNYEDNSFIRR